MKFKPVLIKELNDKLQEEKKQEELRKKYEVPEDIIVVEKSSIAKFLIKTIGRVIRITATILLVIFAGIGLTGLLTPGIREDMLIILSEWKKAVLALW